MKIIGIYANYNQYNTENNIPSPSSPIFYLKPDNTLLLKNRDFYIPDLEHKIIAEAHLVVKINRLGKNIAERFAPNYYNEIGVGIDFTDTNLLKFCIQSNYPWEVAKCFDGSSALGEFINKNEIKDFENLNFSLHLDNKPIQIGNTNDMIFNINKIISYISQFMTLKIGDIIYTGTPCIAPVMAINNELKGYLNDVQVTLCKIK